MNKNKISLEMLKTQSTDELLAARKRIDFILQNKAKKKEDQVVLSETPYLSKFYEILTSVLSSYKKKSPAKLQFLLHNNPKMYAELVEGVQELDSCYESLLPPKHSKNIGMRIGYYRLFFYIILRHMAEKGIPISMTTILRQIKFFPNKLQQSLPYAGTAMMPKIFERSNKLKLRRQF